MNSDERICSIALTLCPGIGHIGAKRLIEGMGSAAEVFSRRKELPEIMPGVNPGVVTALDCPAAFLRAEQEMEFVEKNRLSCLTLKDEAYPSRLRECEDAPIVLFFKGNEYFFGKAFMLPYKRQDQSNLSVQPVYRCSYGCPCISEGRCRRGSNKLPSYACYGT